MIKKEAKGVKKKEKRLLTWKEEIGKVRFQTSLDSVPIGNQPKKDLAKWKSCRNLWRANWCCESDVDANNFLGLFKEDPTFWQSESSGRNKADGRKQGGRQNSPGARLWNAGIRSGELLPLITLSVSRDFTCDMRDIHFNDHWDTTSFPGRGWQINSLQWLNNTVFAGAISPRGGFTGINATRLHQWLLQSDGSGWNAMLKSIEGTIRRATHAGYTREDGQHVRPHINHQCRDLLRVATSLFSNKSLGPLLANKYAESSIDYFARNIAYLRSVDTTVRDNGGSIQGFFRQCASLMMVQLERLEVKEEEERKVGTQQGSGTTATTAASSSAAPSSLHKHHVSYLGYVIGDRAKNFYNGLNLHAWSKDGDGNMAADLVMWEALGVRPARIMCETGGQMNTKDMRELMAAVTQEHDAIMTYMRGDPACQSDAAHFAAKKKWMEGKSGGKQEKKSKKKGKKKGKKRR